MTPRPAGTLADPRALERLLDRVAGRLRVHRARLLLLRAGGTAVALGIALALVDAAVPLPDAARATALAALLLGAIAAALARVRVPRASGEDAQRALEGALGDADRLVTAAVELEAMEGELAHAGAASLRGSIPEGAVRGVEGRLPRTPARRVVLALLSLLVLALAIEATLPGLWLAVLPRIVAPWGDHPPYAATRLRFVAPLAEVPFGGEARFEVETTGLPAASLELRARTAGGEELAVPMYKAGATRWAATLRPVREGLTVWASGAGTRTRRHDLRLDPAPVLEAVRLVGSAPAYAELLDEVREAKAGAEVTLSLLEGSTLALEPRANRPLGAAVLAPEEGGASPIVVALQGGRGSLAAPAPGRYALSVRSVEGVTGRSSTTIRIQLRPDKPPEARFLAPESDAVATPAMTIPLVVEARDDLGLVRVTRVQGWNGLDGQPLESEAGGTSWSHRAELPLADLGVAPGDRIVLGAVARDTRPTGGDPGGQLSPLARRSITIIDEATYYGLLRRRLGVEALMQKYGPLLEELRTLRVGAVEALANDPRDAGRVEQLLEEARELEERIASMKRPESLVALEPELLERLAAQAARIREALEAGDASRLPGAEEELARDELEKLAALAKMRALATHLMRLAERQREVAGELEKLEEGGPRDDAARARLRELAETEQRIAAQLDLWSDRARDVAVEAKERLPEEAGQLGALAEALEKAGATPLVRGAERAARRPDVPKATADATEAARRLEGLIGRCQALGGACRRRGTGLGVGDGGGSADDSLSQLEGMAARSLGLSDPRSGRGRRGAGDPSLSVIDGALPSLDDDAPSLAMYGPEVPVASPAARSGPGGEKGEGSGGEAAQGERSRRATDYRRATRTTTSTEGATLSPEEQSMVDAYFEKLEEPAP